MATPNAPASSATSTAWPLNDANDTSRLFTPLTLGTSSSSPSPITISHRIVLAPLTRYRASNSHIPLLPMTANYYAQRASTPGTLLITEATLISARAGGQANVPGIWSDQQIRAWKQVTDAVHDRGGFVFLQLWALGARADPGVLRQDWERSGKGPGMREGEEEEEEEEEKKTEKAWTVVGPSAVVLPTTDQELLRARPLTEAEIQGYVDDYADAASNAVHRAGFDGVEIHGANGYLPDQFLQDTVNTRTDGWGGSIQKRSRFIAEATKAVIAAVGDSGRVAVRLSPWSHCDGSIGADGKIVGGGGTNNSIDNNKPNPRTTDPTPQFLHVVAALADLKLAYLHLVESRYAGTVAEASYHVLNRRNDPFINLWRQRTDTASPVILAGGFTPETARKAVDELYRDTDVCIAFGRLYISTPDLPFRVKGGLPLNQYDRSTFYAVMSERGYTDYPFSEEYRLSGNEQVNGV